MIHHTELLRSNSDGDQRFSAPVGNYLNEVDCGIAAIPCLKRCLNLEKCAKFGVFVAVLSLVGFFHGAVLNYFRGTSHLWSEHYNVSQQSIDWLIYTNEVFVGIFALCVAYWGNRIHRASWMGGLTIFLAIACASLSVPEIYNPFKGNEIGSLGPTLCNRNASQAQNYMGIIEREFDVITFSIVIIFQILVALATVSFVTHGMTYIDDNISPKHSPGFIGLALAANEVGKQAGIYCSWAPYVIKLQSIFISPVWIVLTILTFIVGVAMAMFPKTLPNVVMMKSVNSLLSLASGNNTLEEEEAVEGFFKSLLRLLKNKILLVNIFSLVFIESALINFGILQKSFNQTKYHVSKFNDSSGYSDPFLIQFTTNLLKQPLVAISVLTSGMVIAKFRPKAKYLVIWNIIVFILVALFFSSTVFWNCAGEIENEHKHSITIPYCSSSCGCSLDGSFQPVCVDKKTYFSPCLAGCRNFSAVHNVYQNCSCGTIVTEGSCDSENCKVILALSQTNSIISSGLLATTVVSNIVINLRCVETQDKALALGLEHTLMGLIPYLPIRIIYRVITDTFCEIQGKKGCQFFSEYFPIFLSIITIVLIVVAAILAIVLLFLLGYLELYNNKDYAGNSDIQMRGVPTNRHDNSSANEQNDLDGRSGEEGVDEELLRRGRQMSDSEITAPRPRSKRDRINSYLSEGDLVPPLKTTLKRADPSTSRNSTNSGLSTDSLKAIANGVGDDHDSFGGSNETNTQHSSSHKEPKGIVYETEF